MYLSVILPIRNEEAHIRRTLEALAAQDYPQQRYEVLVVDGGSTDGTHTVVERFAMEHPEINLRLLENPGQWSSRARNMGVRAARGQLIAVIDGHVHIPTNQLFTWMERLKEEHHALCLARPAPLFVPGLQKGMPLWIALARKSWLAHSRNSFIYSNYKGFVDPESSGFAYDREVFDRVGYFDESFDAAEDVEFHHRLKLAGILAYTSPELTIYSYARETLRGLFRQMVRYGAGRARLVRKHHDAISKETIVPPGLFLFFAMLPLAVVLGWRAPVLGIAYLALLVVYCLTALIVGFRAAITRGHLFSGVFVALAIWITHMGLGWGFLKMVWLPHRRLFAIDHQKRSPAIRSSGENTVKAISEWSILEGK